jgi:hypothetical protein
MIEVGVCVKNHGDAQPELLYLAENALVGTARINHNGVFGDRITDDGTIAS